VLIANDADELVAHLRQTPRARTELIGAAARARVLRDHTYTARAALLDKVLSTELVMR
jgi:hypothetical protein